MRTKWIDPFSRWQIDTLTKRSVFVFFSPNVFIRSKLLNAQYVKMLLFWFHPIIIVVHLNGLTSYRHSLLLVEAIEPRETPWWLSVCALRFNKCIHTHFWSRIFVALSFLVFSLFEINIRTIKLEHTIDQRQAGRHCVCRKSFKCCCCCFFLFSDFVSIFRPILWCNGVLHNNKGKASNSRITTNLCNVHCVLCHA